MEVLQESKDEYKRRALRWMLDPALFIKEVMGITGLTDQQLEACAEIGKLVRAKALKWDSKEDPACLQRLHDEKLESYANCMGLTIRAGKGTGKDALVSMLIQWFLCMYDSSKIVCLGPNERSLKTVLWQEVARWHSNQVKGQYTFLMRDLIQIEAEKIFRCDIPDAGKRWFAFPVVAPIRQDTKRQASALSGQHATYMMILADEAAGINDEHFMPLEDTMSGKINFAILFSQMTRSNGFFFDSHFGKGKDRWIKLHWSSLDSPLVSEALIENIKEKYGEHSNQYRVNVLGEPPSVESDCLIAWDAIANARMREIPESQYQNYEIVIGVDIGLHNDRTICCIRQGPKIHEFYPIVGTDHGQIAVAIMRLANTHHARHVCMDNHVIGDAIFQMCQKLSTGMGVMCHGVKGGWQPTMGTDAARFYNYRAQLWWRVREAFETGSIAIPEDENLIQQLLAMKIETGSSTNKKLLIISKQKLRKILGESPDQADALAYCFHLPDDILLKKKDHYVDFDEDEHKSNVSWMGD